jgi:hypothetical protein
LRLTRRSPPSTEQQTVERDRNRTAGSIADPYHRQLEFWFNIVTP